MKRRIQDQALPHLEDALSAGLPLLPRRPKARAVPAQPVQLAPPAGPAAEVLAAVTAEVASCRSCRLCEARTRTVPGVGNPAARLIFVGEGPGAEEDRTGEPFVGAAGELLTKIIDAMGLKRSDVYITNVVKCRPPENRTPQADEIAACQGYLLRQLSAIQPKVICALGKPAALSLLGLSPATAISKIRGTFHDWHGIPLMPTYHPAYLLRNPAEKRAVWEDMKRVRDFLGELT